MICIIEPQADHKISGGYLFNRELERVSQGLLRRSSQLEVELRKSEGFKLIDSLFLGHAGLNAFRGRAHTGWLLHGLPEQDDPSWIANLLLFPLLILPSQALVKRVKALHPKAVIQICEPGLHPYFFTHILQPEHSGPLRLLTVANFLPGKGLTEACRFLHELDADLPPWTWSIAGNDKLDADYTRRLKLQLETFRMKDRTRFLGLVDPKAGCYAAADLFLFFSREESFGMVLQEAGAMGLSIVSTDVGIASELLRGDSAAVVLERGRENDGRDAVLKLMRDLHAKARPFRQARSHPLLKRSWEDALRDIRSILQC